MYARMYVLERLSFDKLLKMLKILSMLAIDLRAREGRPSTVYVGYLVEHVVPGVLPHIEPIILLKPVRLVHRRQQLLEYSGVKLLGLGSFRVGRTSTRGPDVEISEQSLLAHLDLRGRRLVVDDDLVSRQARELVYWFTPIAMAAGLHRWGLSWRKIVASTMAVAWHYGFPPAYDVEAVAASFIEYAYNRLRYNIYGEERYMVPEALRYVEEVQEEIRKAVDAANHVENPSNLLISVLDGLVDEARKVVQEDVEALKRALDRLEVGDGLKLLGVYRGGLSAILEVLRKDGVEEIVSENNALILVPSETWSPLYLATLVELVRKSGVDELKIVLGYTVQILPQIIFSIEVLEDYNIKVGRRSGKDQLPEIQLETQEQKKLTLYTIPLVAKTPTIAYHQLKTVKEKIKANKLVYIPKHVALAPTLAALKKLEQEGKAKALKSKE